MNTIQNSNRLVQPIARFLRQLLSGCALATAVRKNLHAASPHVAHRPWRAARPDVADGSSRAALGLRPAVKHPRNPAHPDRLPTSRFRQESTLCPAPPQGAVWRQVLISHNAVWRQVSSSHNKERAHDLNPLTSANSPRPSPPPEAPRFRIAGEAEVGERERKSETGKSRTGCHS